MKRFLPILILWFLLCLPTQADAPIYLPILWGNPCNEVSTVSNWKVIVPYPTTNLMANPSAEISGNYAALSGATVTLDSGYQHYGLYSYNVQTASDNQGISFTLFTALHNTTTYVTMRVRGTLPASWDWSLNNVTYTSPTLLEAIDGTWSLYGLSFPGAQASGSTTLYVRQNGSGSGNFNLDGIQVEELSTWTTYCDGTQPGCAWNGAEHASSSSRSAYSRAGGIVYDLEDDYGLKISGMSGSGTAPQELFVDSYSQLPGGELNTIKTNSRVITLTGVITGTSDSNFHAIKQALKSILAKDSVPQDQNGYQPIRLRYTGATVHKEIQVHYEGGLEGEISADKPCAWEDVAIRFIAPNPYWYEIGESAALLDTNDNATFRTVAGRLRSSGQWSSLGPPNASGTYTSVRAIAEDATYVYIGGNFLNFDNIANADYIVRYNKSTGVYSALGSGLNNVVHAITIAPNGDVYIGGEFTNAGGIAAADYLTRWDGSAFNAVGTPNTGAAVIVNVFALLFDGAGNLYIGGNFANWNDIANADNIVKWDGSAYSALSTGLNGQVRDLALGIDGTRIYLAGAFTTINRAGYWNGSSFVQISSVFDDEALGIAVDSTGLVYIGGQFANFIYTWNGSGLSTLGGGVNDDVHKIKIAPDGVAYVSGIFTQAGGISLGDRIARWNGFAWSHLDIDLPGTPVVYRAIPSKYTDPVIPQKYDLFIGFDTTGTGNFAGQANAVNGGTVPTYPKVIFNRSGGTTATIQTVKNEQNGQEILFNYSLLNGETLTVDLTQTKKSINSSFFGSRQDAVLKNSDFGNWHLLPGSNQITSFVSTTGSPTITAYLLYKDQYDSQD